jgi:hypothetical protein
MADAATPPVPDTIQPVYLQDQDYGVVRPPPPTRPAPAEIVQAELDRALPGHRVGRALPDELARELLPGLQLYLVLHAGAPCGSCPKHFEILGAIQGERATLLRSEADLAILLKSQRLPGGEKAALCAALLVERLWRSRSPLRGLNRGKLVEPEQAELKKVEGGFAAEFQFGKGRSIWRLVVNLDSSGAFESLRTEDTGAETPER